MIWVCMQITTCRGVVSGRLRSQQRQLEVELMRFCFRKLGRPFALPQVTCSIIAAYLSRWAARYDCRCTPMPICAQCPQGTSCSLLARVTAQLHHPVGHRCSM